MSHPVYRENMRFIIKIVSSPIISKFIPYKKKIDAEHETSSPILFFSRGKYNSARVNLKLCGNVIDKQTALRVSQLSVIKSHLSMRFDRS